MHIQGPPAGISPLVSDEAKLLPNQTTSYRMLQQYIVGEQPLCWNRGYL